MVSHVAELGFILNVMCVLFILSALFVHRVPLPGMETHIPVIFLNLKRMSHQFQNNICLTCFSSAG